MRCATADVEMLYISVVQLAVALIVVSAISIFGTVAYNEIRAYFQYQHLDIAEVRRPGAWQYNHDFFDKITEFRNDFSGK